MPAPMIAIDGVFMGWPASSLALTVPDELAEQGADRQEWYFQRASPASLRRTRDAPHDACRNESREEDDATQGSLGRVRRSGAARPCDRPRVCGRACAASLFDARVRPLLAQMTLDEKLGQMAQAELGKLEHEDDIERYFLGSVLSGGDADPPTGNGMRDWQQTIDALIERSARTRLKIPILYGVDAVHGHSNVEGAVIFPHNVGLGCTRDAALVEAAARITALEMRATGAQWTFSPCIAVPRDERWGRTYEGFAEDPAVVAELGAAAVRGFQTMDLASPRAVLACAKHFVGDGGTTCRTGRPEAARRLSIKAIPAPTKRRCASFTCRDT